MFGWVKTIGKRYVDVNQFCRGKKIRFQKKRKTSVGRTGFKSWAPLCDIPTSHLVFVTNSFLKVLDIYSIHSFFVVTFMNYPELVGTFRNSLFVCLRHTSKFHHQASFSYLNESANPIVEHVQVSAKNTLKELGVVVSPSTAKK